MNKKQKKVLVRIIVAAVLMILLSILPLKGVLRFLLFMIPYLVIGHDILKKALKGICKKQVFDENFLMAIATVGAIILGEYVEGVAVMLFYQIGELFQSYAISKSRKSISSLMDLRPDYANVETPEGIEKKDLDEVNTGDIIVVMPGEKVPIDGIVIEGEAGLNTAALTGESAPKDVTVGDEVLSGCINMNGLLKIRTTKMFEESTVSRILELVENATSRKSRSENFISKFAKYYTPAVCICAVLLAVLPPLMNLMILQREAGFTMWIYRALTFLVISCPCALVISIPLTFFAGIGGAGREGILIKGSNYMETLAKAGIVVLDKTGTMTKGSFEVVQTHSAAGNEEELIFFAAMAECYSKHPIASSIKAAYGKPCDEKSIGTVREIPGKGVSALVNDIPVLVGNEKLMTEAGLLPASCELPATIVHVAVGGVYAGYLVIADQMKPGAADAVKDLRRIGIKECVMLTGDDSAVAKQVANQLGITKVFGGLLPEDKFGKVEEILSAKGAGEKLAFVGDGINDAPVLSLSDIGIAMGALGSDAAIEAADVVLMDDDPKKIAKSIRIARKCMGIVYQNIYFALGVKGICLILGALGIANMWLAIFADVGVMVLAVLNAIRALYVKNV